MDTGASLSRRSLLRAGAAGAVTLAAVAAQGAGAGPAGAAAPAASGPAATGDVADTGARAVTGAAGTRVAEDGPVRLPVPTGPYAVGTRHLHLVDDRRNDPFAPTVTPRELMVQVWYPTIGPAASASETSAVSTASAVPAVSAASGYGKGGRGRAPYLSAGLVPMVERRFTLPQGSLERVRTDARPGAPVHPALRDAPVVFFGPGRQDPAATGTAFAQDLASHGYVVLGVNHTYDGPVEFPDGRVIEQNPATGDPALLRKYSDVRAADLSFVLDALTGRRGPGPAPCLTAAVSRERVGVFGHSLGGSAAAEVMRTDDRFAAGACLDGALQTAAAQTGLTRPFMLFTEPLELPSWRDFMAGHRAWGRRMVLAGARHYSFTDLAPLGVGLGLAQVWTPEQFAKYFGTIDGRRSQEVTAAYVRAFFDHRLRGRPAPELDDPGSRFPEVTIPWRS
ncbi:alpha/beta hydrolase [Streptomyces sp. MST-110588]|uniref:alpha/beta hydrolase family protein n=1 Tax=Streptomyces sp. MST-110588 TaxID=2833628 RepID=UPI001F5C4340|nr:alpha/beta hydrolase [Streptomyces sp. MST-110588]UNO39247.1 alpha/beta hydrolase [Streptomyces sp. MST-110588]